ncbi:MAG: type II secretion system F family protein [Reyranella sp.]|uniref:type II secretion system F family protein n=1 Tax=Reyranella sp. TaxID=1929291 RepID=UPI001ACFB789|nr:type II secretion system F family protein [Reyranella sp.]MBN9088976.1 type II secretion system F family protein [Reyranella sp.]
MFGLDSHALSLDQVAIVIACGVTATFVTLYVVFSGFFAERRLNDRLEDLEDRTRSGKRTLQMATLRRVERQGRLPTLDKLLWQWFPNASKVRLKLQSSGVNLTLGDFAFASIALAVGVAFLLYLFLDLPPGMVLVGALLIGIGIPNLVIGIKAKKRGRAFNLLFPEAIDLMVRALRAGLPVQEAIGNVSRDIKDPVGGVFKRAQDEMQLGVPIERALWQVARTIQTDEFNFLIVAMSIQRDTGGNLAETLANLSALLRSRQQLRLKIRAFTSEARATMLIMAGLPFLVGGALFLISPGYIGPLFTTPGGQMVAACAAGSMGLGIFIMNKIATIKV